jgi:peroxiredoxin
VTRLVALLALGLACGGAPRKPPVRALALQIEAVDGGSIDVRAYRGRPVVIHLFTTWSLAAQRDVLQLVEGARQYGDLVEIIGIALDPDGYRLVAPWRTANKIPYLVGLGSAELIAGRSALGKVTEVPATFILDPDGAIAHRIARPLAPGELARLLDSMLPQR